MHCFNCCNSCLFQYWRLSSQFPVLTLLVASHQPGLLLQELGQALQATASRFDLGLVAGSSREEADTVTFEPTHSGGEINVSEEGCVMDSVEEYGCSTQDHNDRCKSKFIGVTDGENKLQHSASDVSVPPSQDKSEKYGQTLCQDACKIIQESHNTVDPPKLQHGSTATQKVDGADKQLLSCASASLPESGDKTTIRKEIVVEEQFGSGVAMKTAGGSAAPEKTALSPLDLCSPAHSRESMKTVGPLEKVRK